MFKKLLHKDIYIPTPAQTMCKLLQKNFKGYTISQHFDEHMNNQASEDRSHTYLREAIEKCLKSIKNSPSEAFEVELSKGYYEFGAPGWFITKYCIRRPYSDNQDLVIVIRPHWNKDKQAYDCDKNLVVTAWMNHKEDAHFTLDESKYCSKIEWMNLN